MTVMTSCQRACVVPRHHTTDCHTDTCIGCQPRQAAQGSTLCQPCKGRIWRAVEDLSTVNAWVRCHVQPSTSTGDGPRVTTTRTPPAPLRLDALDDIDNVVAALNAWVDRARAEHPDRPHPPDRAGTRVLAGRVHGAAAGHDTLPAQAAAAWLHTWHDWMTERDWAAAYHDTVTTLARTLRGKYATRERLRKLPTPCPACDRLSLWYHPPKTATAEVTVCCHADDCGAVITHDDYSWHVNREAARYERTPA